MTGVGSSRLVSAALIVATLLCADAIPLAQAPNTTASLLASAGAALETLRHSLAGVVLEEDYLQQARAQVVTARTLRSDLAVIPDNEFGWIEFRDVYEVDRKPIRDRQDRVVQLFTKPSADSLVQARRIVSEGSRFNLVPVGLPLDRTINVPMAALIFLRTRNQSHSSFRRDGSESIAGHRVAVLRFTETTKPRLIGSADEAAAQGAFWIEPESGHVLRTELGLRSRRGTTEVAATIRVNYAEDARHKLWLPRQMEEEYVITDVAGRPVAEIFGRAIYSNIRRFDVVVDESATP
jgi:hypothetical protein